MGHYEDTEREIQMKQEREKAVAEHREKVISVVEKISSSKRALATAKKAVAGLTVQLGQEEQLLDRLLRQV